MVIVTTIVLIIVTLRRGRGEGGRGLIRLV